MFHIFSFLAYSPFDSAPKFAQLVFKSLERMSFPFVNWIFDYFIPISLLPLPSPW